MHNPNYWSTISWVSWRHSKKGLPNWHWGSSSTCRYKAMASLIKWLPSAFRLTNWWRNVISGPHKLTLSTHVCHSAGLFGDTGGFPRNVAKNPNLYWFTERLGWLWTWLVKESTRSRFTFSIIAWKSMTATFGIEIKWNTEPLRTWEMPGKLNTKKAPTVSRKMSIRIIGSTSSVNETMSGDGCYFLTRWVKCTATWRTKWWMLRKAKISLVCNSSLRCTPDPQVFMYESITMHIIWSNLFVQFVRSTFLSMNYRGNNSFCCSK